MSDRQQTIKKERERVGDHKFHIRAEIFSQRRADEAVTSLQLRKHRHRLTLTLTLQTMMEVVLTRLRDFSCKTSTFEDCKQAGRSSCRDRGTRTEHHLSGEAAAGGGRGGGGGHKLDIESALAWLRRELVTISPSLKNVL